MQHLKSKISQSVLQHSEHRSEKKSAIKEIVFPDSCSPIWRQAFALADNVRFTRTPDSEIRRHRAAIDPDFAKILARAEADAKKASQEEKALEQIPLQIAQSAKPYSGEMDSSVAKAPQIVSSDVDKLESESNERDYSKFEPQDKQEQQLNITEPAETLQNSDTIAEDTSENNTYDTLDVHDGGSDEEVLDGKQSETENSISAKPELQEVGDDQNRFVTQPKQERPVAAMREAIKSRFQSVPSNPHQFLKTSSESKALANSGSKAYAYAAYRLPLKGARSQQIGEERQTEQENAAALINQSNHQTETVELTAAKLVADANRIIANERLQKEAAVTTTDNFVNETTLKEEENKTAEKPRHEEVEQAVENSDSAAQNRNKSDALFPWLISSDKQDAIWSNKRENRAVKTKENLAEDPITEFTETSQLQGEDNGALSDEAVASFKEHQAPQGLEKTAERQPNSVEQRQDNAVQMEEQSDVTRFFKGVKCQQPQMRWIAVPAQIADSILSQYLGQVNQRQAPQPEVAQQANINRTDRGAEQNNGVSSIPVDDAKQVQQQTGHVLNNQHKTSQYDAFVPSVSPVMNMQVRLNNYQHVENTAPTAQQMRPQNAVTEQTVTKQAVPNAQAAPIAGQADSQTQNMVHNANTVQPVISDNLDALCSSAVEDIGKNSIETETTTHLKTVETKPSNRHDEIESAHETQTGQNIVDALPDRHARTEPHPLTKIDPIGSYQPPIVDLLQQADYHDGSIISQEVLERSAGLLESVLEDFGVKGEIIHVRPGPVVTLYEFEPAPGVKSSRVIGLSEDIARSMSSIAARVAVIPGRNVIGIELPNKQREMVYLREILQAKAFKTSNYKLPLALGKNIGGEPIIAELAKMPHLLVAGTTGSGKSVAINTMILSLLYRMSPDECRLIMVDPKMLELSVYDGIPHLLTPVVTDPKKALSALKWAVREMEDRYRKMAKLGVRNIDGFNVRVKQAMKDEETIMCTVQAGFDRETGELLYKEEAMDLKPLPYIVIIVDEMADLMMVAGKEIEGAIQRLAQMARAAGIHLIMATQRPSVDVITGTIKANFPTRISFQVTSKVDSRTILGEQGAEVLLGQGDMLYMAGGGRLKRVHGPFVSDQEVEKVVAYLKTQGTPDYLATVTESNDEEAQDGKNKMDSEDAAVAEIIAEATGHEETDDLYIQAVKVVMRDKKCSTSYIQRRLSIGYNKAATLVEKMEEEGLVGEANHVGKREILISADD